MVKLKPGFITKVAVTAESHNETTFITDIIVENLNVKHNEKIGHNDEENNKEERESDFVFISEEEKDNFNVI